MLTKKQEMFVQNIINGMSQREAYKNAYSVKTMSDNAIDREASLLMKNTKVAQRFAELRDELVKPTILSAQERLEYLTRVIKGEEREKVHKIFDGEDYAYDEEADISTKLKAIDLMNKMSGEYVQKIDANVNADVEICVELTDEG